FTGLLEDPSRDLLLDANREASADRLANIEEQWVQRLDSRRRRKQILDRLQAGSASGDDESTRVDGYIFHFEPDKGFGRVRGGENRLTYSFYKTAVDASIIPSKGLRVSFLPEQLPRGKRKALKLRSPLASDPPKRSAANRQKVSRSQPELPRMEGRIA